MTFKERAEATIECRRSGEISLIEEDHELRKLYKQMENYGKSLNLPVNLKHTYDEWVSNLYKKGKGMRIKVKDSVADPDIDWAKLDSGQFFLCADGDVYMVYQSGHGKNLLYWGHEGPRLEPNSQYVKTKRLLSMNDLEFTN